MENIKYQCRLGFDVGVNQMVGFGPLVTTSVIEHATMCGQALH